MSSNDPRDAQQAGGPAQTPPPSRLSPGAASAPASEKPAGSSAPGPGAKDEPQREPQRKGTAGASPDPLRGSKASGFWAVVIVLLIVIVLLAIFVLQNTNSVTISFLGWSGSLPLAAAMMIAAAAGLVVAVAAGTLRIMQLRRRVKQDRKAAR